jgi:hypothetical protein
LQQSLGSSAAIRDPLISETDQSHENRYLKSYQIEAGSGEWHVFAVNLAALAIVLRAIAANMRISIRIASPSSTVSTISASTVSSWN